MKFIKLNNYVFIKNNKLKNNFNLINFDKFVKKNKFFKIYNNQINMKSLVRVKNYSNINKVLNVVFKKGLKFSILKEFNKFNEFFFFDLYENINKYENLNKLLNEKKYFYILENLIPYLLEQYKLIFDIKYQKNVKNVKKLKRKISASQIIYIKKSKRLGFLIKLIVFYLNKFKNHFFFIKLFEFFKLELIQSESKLLIERKNTIYTQILKILKKTN